MVYFVGIVDIPKVINMAYGESGGGWWIIIIAIIILVVLFFAFDGKGKMESVKEWWAGSSSNNQPTKQQLIMPPTSVQSWCQVQEIMVGDTREDFISSRILGWDSLEECCVREVEGFSCALNDLMNLRWCYTGDIGGSINWASVNGYFVETNLYKQFLDDVDKEPIPNKVCDLEKYPSVLRGE